MDPIASELATAFQITVTSLRSISGGDIAAAYLVGTDEGPRFAKVLRGAKAKDMLTAEADGLRALAQNGPLPTPEVIGIRPLDSGACLMMHYISPGSGSGKAMEILGRGLAHIHQAGHSRFGWNTDNYIGRLPQENTPAQGWAEFYSHSRLLPQFRMARDQNLLQASEVPALEQVEHRMADLLPEVSPSLLHGDLWGGNYLISDTGQPYLIDPAVYCGHKEVDLAMSRLFGGFSDRFYQAYAEVHPPDPEWEARNELYQLYYLLVHLNLFGASYRGSVLRICRRFF